MFLFENNWASTLLSGISASDTVIIINQSDADRIYLGEAASVDKYTLTLQAGDQVEIVTAIKKSGNALTVVRGREGTTSFAWPAGSVVEMRVTAAALGRFEAAYQAGYHELGTDRTADDVTITITYGEETIIPAASASDAGVMSAADKAKLDGVQAGATANATDAQLRDRATHTGEQPISSVTGLQSALDGKAAASHTHAIADVTGLQAALDSKEQALTAGANISINRSDPLNPIISASGAGGGLPDAPVDGKLYGRKDASWQEVTAGGAGTDIGHSLAAASVAITSSTGTGTVIPAASTADAGVMSAADKAKLDGIAAGATANDSNAQLRDRATHTGEQAISTVTGLQSALDGKQPTEAGKGLSSNDFTTAEKNKLAGLEASKWKGLHASLSALQTAHPTAAAGDYADVDGGAGVDVARYIWDVSDSKWVAQQGTGGNMTPAQVKSAYESNADTNAYTDSEKTKLGAVAAGATANPNTDSLSEGSTNQYHTAARVRAVALAGLSTATAAVITAADTVLTALGKLQAQISGKQDALVSGSNIKTVGGQSLLGAGDVSLTAAPPTVVSFTGARTLALADAGKYLRGTDAAAQAVTVPPQSSVAWAADTEIHIERGGAGALTIAAGAGVTINRDARFTNAIGGRYGVVTIKRVSADVWTLFGNLVAV